MARVLGTAACGRLGTPATWITFEWIAAPKVVLWPWDSELGGGLRATVKDRLAVQAKDRLAVQAVYAPANSAPRLWSFRVPRHRDIRGLPGLEFLGKWPQDASKTPPAPPTLMISLVFLHIFINSQGFHPKRPKTASRDPRTGPRWPQDAPTTPKMAPGRPQDGPRTPLDSPSRPQNDPRRPWTAPKRPPRRARTSPRRLKTCGRAFKTPPRGSQTHPGGPRTPPKSVQDASELRAGISQNCDFPSVFATPRSGATRL